MKTFILVIFIFSPHTLYCYYSYYYCYHYYSSCMSVKSKEIILLAMHSSATG